MLFPLLRSVWQAGIARLKINFRYMHMSGTCCLSLGVHHTMLTGGASHSTKSELPSTGLSTSRTHKNVVNHPQGCVLWCVKCSLEGLFRIGFLRIGSVEGAPETECSSLRKRCIQPAMVAELLLFARCSGILHSFLR